MFAFSFHVIARRFAWLLILMPAVPRICSGQTIAKTFLLDGTPAHIHISQGKDTTNSKDALIAGRRIVRLGEVAVPTVTWYPVPAANGNHTAPAILVLPGGGYQILAEDLEGSEVCAWLNSRGISAFLLRYRVPSGALHAEPLVDAQEALALIDSKATEWSVDRGHVGVIGFSAGAHLAMRLISSKPALHLHAALIVYPAYLQGKADELTTGPIPADAPPFFLVQAEDDPIGIGNTLTAYREIAKAGIPAEAHLFAQGGHGYGLRTTNVRITHWTDLADVWLAGNGFGPAQAAEAK